MNTPRVLGVLFAGLLIVAILVLAEGSSAQSIPKASVPDVSVRLVAESYVTPETTTINPYTGENITHPSRRVEKTSIELSIKNQPNSGTCIYGVRMKGHFENSWTWLNGYPEEFDNTPGSGSFIPPLPVFASHSDYTVVTYPNHYPANSMLDFQVKTALYNTTQQGIYTYHYLVSESDWSNTQTINTSQLAEPVLATPTPIATPTPNPPTPTASAESPISRPLSTPTAAPPETATDLVTLPMNAFIALVTVPLIAIIILLVVLIRKTKKT
ncbi:MAG: hypothetical protein NWE92_06255 [Candidatus Bathyarchaeota archaeon]|nr:hypothetical protein [Candidatus Bathyarchaeota archaeon]